MNNFQLNNTSVYLGGQCKWDLILSKDGVKNSNELLIKGFQLTPLSNNIPFNKKGDIDVLNDNHSDTIKKFASDLKENFWSIIPENNILDANNTLISVDQSFNSGVSRLSSYQVYNKQYNFLLPLWLEYIPNKKSYLKIKLYITTKTSKTIMGEKDICLCLQDDLGDDAFHNKFINYFNNWLEYLNIIPNPLRYNTEQFKNLGNNRTMNINIDNYTTTISGVSIDTGQLVNEVNCDYIPHNLLNYERPNIETDYILTSLFKSHNLIASQLFNFNLCFNIDDIVSPVLMQQIKGTNFSVHCDVVEMDANENSSFDENVLEKRSIYTNYEYIPKKTLDPFIFLCDTTIQGDQEILNYTTESENEAESDNVLDYLRDYQVVDICDKNKYVQYICHWGPVNHEGGSFNLYDGYKYNYHEFGKSVRRIITNTSTVVYKYSNHEIPYSNGITVSKLYESYVGGLGEFAWVDPSKIIYVGYDGCPNSVISNNIALKLMNGGSNGLLRKNCINIQKCNQRWNTNVKYDTESDPDFVGISLVYICSPGYDVVNNIKNIYSDDNIVLGSGDNWILIKDSNTAVVYTKDFNNLLIDNILKIINSVDDSVVQEELVVLLEGIKQSIIEGNNSNFYGFNTEIGVAKNDLNEYVYYKLDSKSTYVYRMDGDLSPFMISDSDYSLNYKYGLDVNSQNIIKLDNLENLDNIYEINYYGNNWGLILLPELNFNIIKESDSNQSLKSLIKSHIKKFYNFNNDNIVDYVYDLYKITFDYEYDYSSEKEIQNSKQRIIYKVKMDLI